MSRNSIKLDGAQAELQAQAPDLVEERGGVPSDKPAPVNGAAPLSNGRDDGARGPASAVEAADALPGETGQDEAGAGSDNLRGDTPCTDGGGAGDAPSAEAHAEKSGLVVPEKYNELIMLCFDELKFNVVPNNPEKKCPAVKWKELQDRRVTEEELAYWHNQGLFKGGVGFISGAISGVVVIDSDGPPGEAVLKEYEALHGPLNGNPWQVFSDTLEIADLPEGLLEFIAAKAAAAKLVAKAAKEKTREGIAIEVKRELKKYPVPLLSG